VKRRLAKGAATMVCEVCGKPASVHLTDIDEARSPQKMEHHYCRDHLPPDMRRSPEDEVKAVQQMIAQLDAREMDPAQKDEFRWELHKLAEDIAAGRKRFGDVG
jgi:hypothetical protein